MGGGNSKQNHLTSNKSKDVAERNSNLKEIKEDSEPDVLSNKIEKAPEVASNCNDGLLGCDDFDDVFYKFVILHGKSDIEEASRIQHMLQKQFHIEPGIIFADMPAGRQTLQNLEVAVNGSAWTIILLTENFLRETWCEYQSYATLINSINKQHKYNSVIPVRPLTNGLSRQKTPFALQAINALEEGSPAFAQQVEKTFQESLYEKQKEVWKKERWIENQLE